jgi:hypothetical protein|tara:strand:+ start:353 stop:562 length:210 start_codon:yes stop_codon:yes gene_type:complete
MVKIFYCKRHNHAYAVDGGFEKDTIIHQECKDYKRGELRVLTSYERTKRDKRKKEEMNLGPRRFKYDLM